MDIGVVLGFDGGRGRGMTELADAARRVEALGLASLWLPEHVVFVQGATSRYPYADDGAPPVGRRPGTYDPLVGLTVAALVTERIRLGTGVLVLPQREPVTVAQQIVALDHASAGRFDLGIGVGWLREEFEALGVPWARRGARTDDHLRAMRALWTQDVAEHHGEFTSFSGVQAWPKPVQQPGPPVWVGGNVDASLRRAATLGDGWYGWKLSVVEVVERMARLRALCEEHDRDPATVGVKIGLPWPGDLDELRPYADALAGLGVAELVVAPGTAGVDQRERLEPLAALQR